MELIKRILKELFTDDQNAQDVFRWLAVVTVVAALYFEYKNVVDLHNEFHIQDFGIGMAGIFGGVGVAVGLRKDGRVDQDQDGHGGR